MILFADRMYSVKMNEIHFYYCVPGICQRCLLVGWH